MPKCWRFSLSKTSNVVMFYGKTQDGSKIITRSKYVEIKSEKADTPEKAKWPEFKTCKFITEAIVSEGIDKGEMRRVCAEADCPIHHPKKQSTKADASFKAEQGKSRREQSLAIATGMRVLQTIVAAVPVRLMKRDFLFIAEQMLPLLDDKRLEMVARKLGIANTRMKDFHDLYSLSRLFSFEGQILSEAIVRTFERRKTRLPSAPPIAFTAEFFENESKQRQWTAFNGKNKLYIESVPLKTVVGDIEQFVMPLVRGVAMESQWNRSWQAGGPWQD